MESWRRSGAGALLTDAECAGGGAAPAAVPALPPRPFAGCPELEAAAQARCPPGRFYRNCLTDVGVACALEPWVAEAAGAGADFLAIGGGDAVEVPDAAEELCAWADAHAVPQLLQTAGHPLQVRVRAAGLPRDGPDELRKACAE